MNYSCENVTLSNFYDDKYREATLFFNSDGTVDITAEVYEYWESETNCPIYEDRFGYINCATPFGYDTFIYCYANDEDAENNWSILELGNTTGEKITKENWLNIVSSNYDWAETWNGLMEALDDCSDNYDFVYDIFHAYFK